MHIRSSERNIAEGGSFELAFVLFLTGNSSKSEVLMGAIQAITVERIISKQDATVAMETISFFRIKNIKSI